MRCVKTLITLFFSMTAAPVFAGGVAANVGISGFTYTPSEVTIEAGETVAFEAEAFHPFTLDDAPSIVCQSDCNVHFRSPGTYGFYCVNHGDAGGVGMSGTVTVTASSITDRIFIDPFELALD